MIRSFLLFSLLVHGMLAHGQHKPVVLDYDWDPTPSLTVNPEDTSGVITMKHQITKEYTFDSEDRFTEYLLEHEIMYLNSDLEIERNNKVYIPASSSAQIIRTKGRVIKKDGTVIELDESKILTAEDEETGATYRYFTYEGIEKGSFIEYLYVLERFPSYNGTRVSLQGENTRYNVGFDLYAPNHLVFLFKSYNGLPDVKADTLSTEVYHWFIHLDTVEMLTDETQSAYEAERQFLVYKLDKNLINGARDISSYGQTTENIYNYMVGGASKSDLKAVDKFVRKVNLDHYPDDAGKIRALEDYIKENIRVADIGNDQLSEVSFAISQKITNENGITRLFWLCFKNLGIDAQLVVTSDRHELRFDKDFEADNYLSYYLFYFPGIKQYLSPDDIGSRLGYPPSELTSNYGLFIKETSLGEAHVGVGKIRYIDPVPWNKSYDTLLVNVTFNNEDPTQTNLQVDHAVGGYYAMYLQTILHLLDEKDLKEALEGQINYLNEDMEIKEKTVYNGDAASFGFHPLRVVADASSDAFVEKAGNKYLFKMGELIGPQMEMYQRTKRKLPVVANFGHVYHRVITFTIPEGYRIDDLEKIRISNQGEVDGKPAFVFHSDYTREGNVVTITVDEYYTETDIPVELFEAYRRVINSAADFNKITLVMQPL